MDTGKLVTYTFDMAAVVTVQITTDAGENAARRAANSLVAISVAATRKELVAPEARPETIFDVSTVAPRGRGYLVNTTSELESAEAELIPEPLTGNARGILKETLDNAFRALEGDSASTEHDALYGVASAIVGILNAEL